MDTTLISKTRARVRPAKNAAAKKKKTNAGELLLADLAARRARIHELLRLVRLEFAREVEASRAATRYRCRAD